MATQPCHWKGTYFVKFANHAVNASCWPVWLHWIDTPFLICNQLWNVYGPLQRLQLGTFLLESTSTWVNEVTSTVSQQWHFNLLTGKRLTPGVSMNSQTCNERCSSSATVGHFLFTFTQCHIAFVCSWIDNYSVIHIGFPLWCFAQHERMLWAAPGLTGGCSKFYHALHFMQDVLHWLPVSHWIRVSVWRWKLESTLPSCGSFVARLRPAEVFNLHLEVNFKFPSQALQWHNTVPF